MSAHTPGPWTSVPRVDLAENGNVIVESSNETICHVFNDENAPLIAKAPIAPKLAEALHALVNAIYREYPEKVPFYCRTEVESAMSSLTEWDAQ